MNNHQPPSYELEELPDGWVQSKLGDICEPIKQIDPRKTMPDRLIKYIDISSVDNEKNEIVEHKEVLGSEAPSRARKPIRADDVLFATVRTYLRNVALVSPEYDGEIASTGFCVLRPVGGVRPGFVFRYLLTNEFIERISDKQRGISYPAVTDRDVYAEWIPLPPEAEQRRIVSKLEALLIQSRRGREALDGVPDLLAQFRQAVLAAAFRGDLTRRNPADEPASVLLERIRAERRSRWEEGLRAQGKDPSHRKYKEPEPPDRSDLPELPEGWVWVTVEQACQRIVDCLHSTPKFKESGRMCIDTNSIKPGQIVLEKVRYVDEATFHERNRRMIPQEDDVLFSREGALLGVAARVPANLEFCLGQRMMIFRLGQCVDAKYFENLLNSPLFRSQYLPKISGTASPHLNIGDIRRFAIPLSPLSEQRRIVARIEALFAQADRLEAQVAATRRRLEQVDQAVLARAFRGELVEQDPEDEPASALLERIRET